MSYDSFVFDDDTADLFTTPLPLAPLNTAHQGEMEVVSIGSELSDSPLVAAPLPSAPSAPRVERDPYATLYCAPQDIERNGLSSTAVLSSNPKGQILLGCVPNLDPTHPKDRLFYENPQEACTQALESLCRTIGIWVQETRDSRAMMAGGNPRPEIATRVVQMGMLVLESHQTETLHIHWAIKLDRSISMSLKAFRRLMDGYLVPWAGKWSMFKLGSCWQQLENYYMKNVAPRGLANATIVFYPLRTVRQVVQEQAIREKHGKNNFLKKNQDIFQSYQEGTIARHVLNEEGIRLEKFDQTIRSCRMLACFLELTPELKQKIANTEVWFIFGPSRTGKTYAAQNRFCYETPGDANSRPLRILRVDAAGLQAGFLNGYEGQEVVVIDEIPQFWADCYKTVKTLLTWMDNYEGDINVKSAVVKKRVWRWVLISNYAPNEVLANAPKQSFQQNPSFALPVKSIDYQGIWEPFRFRVTGGGTHPERSLQITSESGHNPGMGTPTFCKPWCWVTQQMCGEEKVFFE